MKNLQIAIAADHTERYFRCRQKLDSAPASQVRHWLERLPELERELCRVVLNNIREGRKAKSLGIPLSEQVPIVASDELRAMHKAYIYNQLNKRVAV